MEFHGLFLYGTNTGIAITALAFIRRGLFMAAPRTEFNRREEVSGIETGRTVVFLLPIN
jgi:hypothetical protein